MRLGEYGRIERDISAAENGTIWHRWRYGRRLMCDTDITTPNGNFRHGVIEKIVRASGGKLTERELRARRQCGKAYPNRSQIRQALTDFETWNQLLDASFPPYEGEEDELPYNPLLTEELIKQHETGAGHIAEDSQYEGGGIMPRDDCEEHGEEPSEGALIPRNTYPDTTPLSELVRWAEQERELARRFNARVDRLCHYIDSLVKAANGDLNMTLGEAEKRLHGRD
jgi:hypothetical protein